ncbi:MAG: helix-turn-helix domain-containing protein [Nitrososphaerota archaeon]|nr:helix-turn-helix domain-containing protein [Nitrososphaerota archaeon]
MLRQVSITIPRPSLFGELSSKYACKFDVIGCKNFDECRMSLLVEVTGEHAEDLIRELKRSPLVRHVYFSKGGQGKLLTMVIVDTPAYCKVARETGVFCMSCPWATGAVCDGGEKVTWNLLVRDSSSFSRALELLETSGTLFEVKNVSKASFDYVLTPRQKEVLLIAKQLGYFEFPRRVSLTALAEKLSIKPSTLSELLRNAETKIVQNYVQTAVFPDR